METVIRNGIGTFVEVGRALREIRDTRLYRDTHDSFESYCKEAWDFGRVHAHRLIEASAAALDCYPLGNCPGSERQARELVPLDADGRRAVWQKACEGGCPTAERVRAAREEYLASLALARLEGLSPEGQLAAVAEEERAALGAAADTVKTILRKAVGLELLAAELDGATSAIAHLRQFRDEIKQLAR